MTRDEAANQVKDLGADIDTEINKRTDYVIVGQGTALSKTKKIDEFNLTGSTIKI